MRRVPPPSDDANNPYRAAIAALAENRAFAPEQEDALHPPAHQDHPIPNALAGLPAQPGRPPQRMNQFTRIPPALVAQTILANATQAHFADASQNVGPSGVSGDSFAQAAAGSVTLRTIRDQLQSHHLNQGNVGDDVLALRFERYNLSLPTYATALHIAGDVNHPTMRALGATPSESLDLLYSLGSFVKNSRLNMHTTNAVVNAQDNPNTLVANVLENVRNG